MTALIQHDLAATVIARGLVGWVVRSNHLGPCHLPELLLKLTQRRASVSEHERHTGVHPRNGISTASRTAHLQLPGARCGGGTCCASMLIWFFMSATTPPVPSTATTFSMYSVTFPRVQFAMSSRASSVKKACGRGSQKGQKVQKGKPGQERRPANTGWGPCAREASVWEACCWYSGVINMS